MATYTELYDLMNESALRNKVAVACLVAAEAVRLEAEGTANHANRLTWAKATFTDPRAAGERMLPAILAQNATLTKAQILAASDGALQTAVNSAVNVFAVLGA